MSKDIATSKVSNFSKGIKTILCVVAIIVLSLLAWFLKQTIPKLPFESVSFYCKRTTEAPFTVTSKEYNECMRKNTRPSDEVMNYVEKHFGSDLRNDDKKLCAGKAIERYLGGDNLQKFLNGTPAINLIGKNKAADLTADLLKCT